LISGEGERKRNARSEEGGEKPWGPTIVGSRPRKDLRRDEQTPVLLHGGKKILKRRLSAEKTSGRARGGLKLVVDWKKINFCTDATALSY